MKLFPALVCILAILSTDAAGQPTISVSPAGGGYCDTPTICACGLSGCN